MKCRWVLEIKRNGVFRARLVACGYSQIPGLDFQESYSPVSADVTLRIIFVVEMVYKLDSLLLDVETAFLYGDLEGIKIDMECPEGMECEDDECLELLKTIYGLVQAARAFWKKLSIVLLKLGFKQSEADPCLFENHSENGIVFVVLWVDDCYFAGTKVMLDDTIAGLRKHFNVKVQESPQDFLSCEIRHNKDKAKCWIGQPHLI